MEACIQVEQSRLWTLLSQALGLVWWSSGLLLSVLVQRWEWLLGAYTRKMALSQLFG